MIQFNSLGYTQSDDLSVVLNLVNELTTILHQNRAASNDMIALADTLDTDDDDETDSESTSGAPTSSAAAAAAAVASGKKALVKSSNLPSLSIESNNKNGSGSTSSSAATAERNDEDTSNKKSGVSSLLARENASLRSHVSVQRARNRALARLLVLTQHTLDKCVSGLRTLVHSHTTESLEIHKRYIDTIHGEQKNSIEMELQNAELEMRILQISKTLRDALRLSSVPHVLSDQSSRKSGSYVSYDGTPTSVETGEGENTRITDHPNPTIALQNVQEHLLDEGNSEETYTKPDISDPITYSKASSSLRDAAQSLNEMRSVKSFFLDPNSRLLNDSQFTNPPKFNEKYQSYLPISSILNNSHIHAVPQDGKTWSENDGDLTQMPDYVMGLLDVITTTSEQLKDKKSLLYKDLRKLPTGEEFDEHLLTPGHHLSLNEDEFDEVQNGQILEEIL